MKLIVVTYLLAAGCVTPAEDTGSTSQAIGSGSDPADPPPVCEATPACSLTYLGGYVSSLQSQLRCSQSYRYFNGSSAGFIGGIISFCPDSSVVRNLLGGSYAYQPGYCSTCLNVPVGKIAVVWSEFWGPGCPSSCAPRSPPPQL